MYHPSSGLYGCPLAMTDGAARLIEIFGDDELKNDAFKGLTSRNPMDFKTSGHSQSAFLKPRVLAFSETARLVWSLAPPGKLA